MADRHHSAIAEEDLVPLSSLQHMLYCPRQCALIHNEQQWEENLFTADGRILHQRVDVGGQESRGDLTIHRGVRLRSFRLGVAGIADVVEIHPPNRPFPVEYKRGRPKAHRADEVQLCAQAFCLEEMLDVDVQCGALFYGEARRRKEIVFDEALRRLTEQVATETRDMIRRGETPLPHYDERKCGKCSLQDICQPQALQKRHVRQWLDRAVAG